MPVLHAGGATVLFVHVPKTGGTSIATALRELGQLAGVDGHHDGSSGLPCSPQHFHAPLLRAVHEDFRAPASPFAYAFMVVRDPFDRLVSEFRWRLARRAGSGVVGRYRRRVRLPGMAVDGELFADWFAEVSSAFAVDPFCLDNHIRPQSEFEVFSLEVHRFEDGLQTPLDRVAAAIGSATTPEVGHANPTRARPGVPLRLPRRLRDRYLGLYADDHDRYGYALPEFV